MRENKYTVRIFDGIYTSVYTTKAIDTATAEKKIVDYHTALGGNAVKVTTTQMRG